MSESHFYQALKQISGKEPPKFMMEVTTDDYLDNFSGERDSELVTWALSSNIPWITGQGLIDAAIILVRDAAGNGNILEDVYPEHTLCLYGGKHKFHYFGNQRIRRCNHCNCTEEEVL